MTAILYPVAANAELALSRPLGRAARESEARRRAGEAVVFATDPVGPAFATREAALDAYRGRVDDDRTGAHARHRGPLLPAGRAGGRRRAPTEGPSSPATPTATAGRSRRSRRAPSGGCSVSYWRIGTAERPLEAPQARAARKAKQEVDPETLRAIARAPMRAIKPQQPLDIGLFEIRPPEAPHIVMPDE